MTDLKEKFNKDIIKLILKEGNFKNIYAVPRLEKVVVSTKIGRVKDNAETIKKISKEMEEITGQKAKINKSKHAVSSFKLRVGEPVGLTVTLRNRRMYDFIFRLCNVALPRVRDFHGLSKKGFDGRGNYSLGVSEYIIMPEVEYENVSDIFGFQVNICTTAKNNEEGYLLLKNLGFPFEKK